MHCVMFLPSRGMAHHIPVWLLYHGVLVNTVSVFWCVFCSTRGVIAHLHVRQAKRGVERVGQFEYSPSCVVLLYQVGIHLIKW